MNRMLWTLLVGVLAAAPVLAQEDEDKDKWKPYQFKGNERYEYKMVVEEEGEMKVILYVLDIRKKGDEDCEVTWTIKTGIKKGDLGEKTLWGAWGGFVPTWTLMNPLYGAFISQLKLQKGEKMSLFGAGIVKVSDKETVGGRTGLTCKLYSTEGKGEELAWEWTVDPELALPIKSVMYENGKEKSRAELVSYRRD